MDPLDSSGSMSAVSRDGSSVEDDGVSSDAAATAKEAALLFQSRKFTECVDALNQILIKKQDDPKVLHNVAIAEYFKDGCSNPRKLLEVLCMVKKRSEELACASCEQLGDGFNGGDNCITLHFSSAKGRLVFTDEFDTSVATLNIATVWFHLHKYTKALSVLEPLYQKIERLDETTALHICLLLLDVVLANRDASKCLEVLNYIEKTFGVASHAEQCSNPASKPSPSPTNTTNASITSDAAVNVNFSESSLSRTLSDEAVEHDNLLSTLHIGGHSMPWARGVRSSNDISWISIDRSDLKLKLHLYKVRFFLLTKNMKAAKREVKLSMNIAHGDSSMALLLKSQLEYACGNHRKAIKLLMASTKEKETRFSGFFNNNLGCIHYQLRKPCTSAVFFSRALKLSTFSRDRSLLILYNCGLQYLACRRPVIAANCFWRASLVLHDRPLLWVRLAECCLMEHEKAGKTGPRSCVIGKGKWRTLVLEGARSSRSDLPQLSIHLARQCLWNSLHLLQLNELNQSMPASKQLDSDSKVAALLNSVLCYENIRRGVNCVIEQGVLVNLAYVELELENPLKALAMANSLVVLPGCSSLSLFLGHVYAAEALCMLNRVKEAADHLIICLETMVSELGVKDGQFMLYVNLAAVSAMQGELGQAERFAAEALSTIPKHPEAVVTLAYVDLMRGKVKDALMALRCCGRVTIVPGNSILIDS